MVLQYKPGSSNMVSDALSRAPVESEARVLQVEEDAISSVSTTLEQVQREQRKGVELKNLIDFLTKQSLPEDSKEINVVLNAAKKGYYVVDDILYYEGPDIPNQRRVVVPTHLQQRILEEHHDSPFAGHFAAKKISQ